MIKDLIVIGAGNPDIVRIIEDINKDKFSFNFLGFTDLNENLINKDFCGYPILGKDDILDSGIYKSAFIVNNTYSTQEVRKKTSTALNIYMHRFCNLIHPSANIGKIKIGVGNVIADGVIIQSMVNLGNNNIIHSASIISHETKIGDNCLLSVNVKIGSRSIIGDYCYFGISATTLPQLNIESGCYVGGGSVLLNNLKPNSRVFGNPARLIPNKL